METFKTLVAIGLVGLVAWAGVQVAETARNNYHPVWQEER